jgi:hypothetical protein
MADKEKVYIFAEDPGYARKIVFINKDANEFKSRNLSLVMPIVEKTGNEDQYLGYLASAPTIYTYLSNFHETAFEAFYRHQGSLYEMHQCPHKDIVVYCHIKKLDEYEEGSAAGKFIKDLMSAFPPKKN